MIEAEVTTERLRDIQFEEFMEQTVPVVLGISLQELRNTEAYQTQLENIRLSQSALLSSEENEMLPLVSPGTNLVTQFGLLYAQRGSEQAEPMFCDPEKSALIATLGERILENAANSLPPEIEYAADAWALASAHERAEILKYVYDRAHPQRWRQAHGDVVLNDEPRDEEKSIRLQDIQAWPDGDALSCLGMAVMLSGFARRAGANFLITDTIVDRGQTNDEVLSRGLYGIDAAIRSKGIEPNERWLNHVANLNEIFHEAELEVRGFHVAVAIEVGDGRWFHIDPYQFDCIELTEKKYDLVQAKRVLGTLSEALPGRTILATQDEVIEVMLEIVDRYVAIGSAVSDNVLAFMQPYLDRQEVTIDEFVAELATFNPTIIPEELFVDKWGDGKFNFEFEWNVQKVIDMTVSNYMAAVIMHAATQMYAEADPDDVINNPGKYRLISKVLDFANTFNERFAQDKEFRDVFLKDIIAAPLYLSMEAIDEISAEYRDGTAEPETTLGLALPAFALGSFVLSHLRVWGGHGNKYVSAVLASQSSSQFLWHEAMADTDPDVSPEMAALERSLKKLDTRLLHQRVAWRLFLRDREGGERDGQEITTGSSGGDPSTAR